MGFFKQKEVTPKVATIADPYGGVRKGLTGWLESQIGKPAEEYKGKMVAGMSSQEKESMDWLKKYGEGGPSPLRTAAVGEMQKTLSGAYDPTSSPYYQAVKAESARNLTEAKEGIAGEAAGGGRYWTGARLGEQREATTDVTIGLNKFLGGLAERERARKLEVLPLAGQFAREEEEAPLRKTAAFQEYGALPRNVKTAELQAIYNEWLRTQERPMEIGRMAAGVQKAPMYGQVGYAPSGFEQYVKPFIEPAIQAAIAAGTGGASLPFQGAYNIFKGMKTGTEKKSPSKLASWVT